MWNFVIEHVKSEAGEVKRKEKQLKRALNIICDRNSKQVHMGCR